MSQTDEKLRILVELKPGIPLTETDLVTDPGEYWLPDENNIVTTTGYTGVITNNLWKINGEVLETDSTGTISEYWELDGTIIQTVV